MAASIDSSATSSSSDPLPLPFERFYPIGIPGQPWTQKEEEEWKATIPKFQRSYQGQVVDKLQAFMNTAAAKEWAILEQYGALSHNPGRYPLWVVRSKDWKPTLPNVLITGGVHGYETSGVQGALLFLQTQAQNYVQKVNFVVAPCVSPWSYEHCQRWQADLMDPNRSFFPDRPEFQTEESKALMDYLFQKLPSSLVDTRPGEQEQGNENSKLTLLWTCHVDLHETTDSDGTEFRPAKFARQGLPYNGEHIPDGFYLVGNSLSVRGAVDNDKDEEEERQRRLHQQQLRNLDFLQAIVKRVETITHIAPTDEQGNLVLNLRAVAPGICLLPKAGLGLCGGVTRGTWLATTEMYPDSPNEKKISDQVCNQVQVTAVTAALDYILALAQ